jgi:hypothetical protein
MSCVCHVCHVVHDAVCPRNAGTVSFSTADVTVAGSPFVDAINAHIVEDGQMDIVADMGTGLALCKLHTVSRTQWCVAEGTLACGIPTASAA